MCDKQNPIDQPLTLSAKSGQPETTEQLINYYGTYEIQPTADSDNVFPTIAQGLPKTDPPKRGE